MAGYTYSSGAGRSDSWILKLDSNGDIGDSCVLVASTSFTPVYTSVYVFDTSITPENTTVTGIDTNVTVSTSNAETEPQCSTINEDIAPTVTIDSPGCNTYQVQIYSISGTASDDSSGVELVEVQIIDEKGWYVTLDPNTPFIEEPTWLTALGTTAWSLNTSSVNWTAGFEYTINARATDFAGNQSSEETCAFTFVNWVSYTTLTINLSAQRILFGDTVDVSGTLTPLPDSGQSMEGLDITINVTSPSGKTTPYTTSSNELGQYVETGISGFDEEGSWTIQASSDGVDNLYNGSESESVTLLVGESAGYAIIVEGKISSKEGIESHNKTANRIYDKLIERSFVADDIYYFNYDIDQPDTDVEVDDIPTKTDIQYAIETWASDKLAATPAPLYIIMVNHGDVESFHIDNEIITPSDLDSWLDTLESNLDASNPIALDKKRIIILGYCYSGSFISALSKEGRIVITSAAEDEESYKGPSESDGIRSGEYFLEELFTELGRGYSLKESFQSATESTEDYTDKGADSANTANMYFDNSVQHPLLDDNGDSIGTNDVTDGTDDGKEAEDVILGSGETYTNAGNNPAEVVDVTDTKYSAPQKTLLLFGLP